MPNNHPAAVAANAAMLDHMLDGRFILGISPGGLLSDAEVFGNLDKDRTAMFVEAIDQILAIWSGEPPYNLQGKYWTVSTERTLIPELGQGFIQKPLQRPHPPIVVTAVAPFSKGVTEAAARGWEPISANFLLPRWVKTHWPKYVEGCAAGNRPAELANWRVAKSVFVADDMETARRYATDSGSPYRQYYGSLTRKLVGNGRANLFKRDQNEHDAAVTVDRVMDDVVIWGTPEKVAEELVAFRDEVGAFGTLLYAGHDWADKALAVRSIELLAEKVLPMIERDERESQAA
jgi:alkanesulfonate monooxygenase SsuD/methylene tetrahydromethanopterin reductase-like flavin-dependent oxidoreductase (luciferase family)